MAEFSKLVITNKGQALIAKMIAGKGNIDFTKICASSTTYTLAQLEALTSLSNIKQTSLISKVTRTNEVAIKVETAFTNNDLTAGYYMRTLGLYAVDPDAGEILYAVTIENSGNCYMPPYNGVTVSGAYVQLVTTVGNADNVSLEVDAAAVATIGDIQELQKEIADLEAYVGYTASDIYGVEVDFVNKKFTRLAGAVNRSAGAGFDKIAPFGGRKRCNLTNDGKVVAYYGEAGFTTTGKLTQAVTIAEGENAGTYAAGTIVQTMVEQPKFYYKVVPLLVEHNALGSKVRKARYYVSASAYILDDAQVADFANDMLCSIANAKPASGLNQNLTRANTRKLAQKRGSGWEQGYAATAAASQLLMLVEYATFNVQSVIGNGAVNKTDDGTTSMTENSGATVSLGNASGAVTNANGIQIVSYRGEENFWGNIWWWVDGMNEQNPSTFAEGDFGTLFVADHGFADDSSASPYKNTGIHPCYGGGYVSAFGWSDEFDWLFIPVEKNGNSSLPVGDYYWNGNPGWRVARLGGRWSNGATAGAFYWDLYYAASYRDRHVGGRLVYVPSKKAA